MRDVIIWAKSMTTDVPDKIGAGINACAWGYWKSPLNPAIRNFSEVILVFYKAKLALQHRGETDLTAIDFMNLTKSVWYIKTETFSYHPAPFPLELPKRLIKLYTYIGDFVCDPMCGSGTTCLAAKMLGRDYIGVDISEEYVTLSRQRVARVEACQQNLSAQTSILDSNLSNNAKILFFHLLSDAVGNSKVHKRRYYSDMSQDEIAGKLRCSIRHARRTIKELMGAGIIDAQKHNGNRYRYYFQK